ncbi:MAG: hypothetical protein PVH41_06620 [Anaerolineae bacterium]|jgi:hypothetical protein
MNERAQGEFEVRRDEDEGIVRNRSWGDLGEASANRPMSSILDIAEVKPGPVLVPNHLTEAGKVSSGPTKVYAQMLKSDRLAKHTFVGLRTLTRVTASFLVRASGAVDARGFGAEDEALRWLKGDVPKR